MNNNNNVIIVHSRSKSKYNEIKETILYVYF